MADPDETEAYGPMPSREVTEAVSPWFSDGDPPPLDPEKIAKGVEQAEKRLRERPLFPKKK